MPSGVPPRAKRTFEYFILFVIGLSVLLLAFRLGVATPDFEDAMSVVAP